MLAGWAQQRSRRLGESIIGSREPRRSCVRTRSGAGRGRGRRRGPGGPSGREVVASTIGRSRADRGVRPPRPRSRTPAAGSNPTASRRWTRRTGAPCALRRSELAALTVEQIGDEQPLRNGPPRPGAYRWPIQDRPASTPSWPDSPAPSTVRSPPWTPGFSSPPSPPARCCARSAPVTASWTGPLHPASVNKRVHPSTARAVLPGGPYSAHSLCAGFVTYAAPPTARSLPDPAPLRGLGPTTSRLETIWQDNAVTQLGL